MTLNELEVGRFALAEHDRPVRVTPTGDGFEVSLDGSEATLSPAHFVAATVTRLPDRPRLDRRLRESLACLV